MFRGMTLISQGVVLSYFLNKVRSVLQSTVNAYKVSTPVSFNSSTSEEKQNRLLQESQVTTDTSYYQKTPENSQLELFQTMYTRLLNVQGQLNIENRDDLFLQDQLISCITEIQEFSVIIKQPSLFSFLDAKKRNASLFSFEPESATKFVEFKIEVFHELGRRFCGSAVRTFSKRPQFKSEWSSRTKLSGIEGCWICSKTHKAE